MQVHQNLSILFYRKRKKKNKQTGHIPLYCRVTIDGLEDEISTGCKILDDDWDTETKQVKSSHPDYKVINKKLGQMRTDLQRHFDLVVAKKGLATPQLVFAAYKTPINGANQRAEQAENAAFSVALDELIKEVVKHLRKIENLKKKGDIPPSRQEILQIEKEGLIKQMDKLGIRGRKIWDNKDWPKTLTIAIDEFLFHFMELLMADKRKRPTFSKQITTKTRIQEFLMKRFKKEDMLLSQLDVSFMEDFTKYVVINHKNSHNTVWKHVLVIKEMIDRAFVKGWMPINPFALYQWSYKEPNNKDWPTIEQMDQLVHFEFGDENLSLSEQRYIFIFQSYSGIAYAELYKLKPEHLVTGIDNKTWIDQRRQKTDVPETLPLLPICLEILEIFKNDPRCQRRGKCLPVMSNQAYNRNLKEIGNLTSINCLNNSHQARYFFANELAYANGIDLHEVGVLLGQNNAKSVKTYVKTRKKKISENMQKVEAALMKQGNVMSIHKPTEEQSGAKVIQLGRTNSTR